MKFLQALAYADVRRVILDFLCANEMVTVFCSCLSLRLPCGENIQDIKQCYLSWLNSSGVDARLLQILACPVTRNAVTDFLYARDLVLTYLSCRTLKLGFLDDIEDVRKCWLRWWDAQRDKWVRTGEGGTTTSQMDDRSHDQKQRRRSAVREDLLTVLVLGPLGLQTSVPMS